MSEVEGTDTEALLGLISIALDELSDAVMLSQVEESVELQQLCCKHIDNLIEVSEQA